MPASAFGSGNPVPNLQDGLGGTSVFVQKHPYRKLQDIVATGLFFGNLPRYDNIIVDSDDTDSQIPSDSYFLGYFGKALAFLRLECIVHQCKCDTRLEFLRIKNVEYCSLQYN